MEVMRRSERTRASKVSYTPGKPIANRKRTNKADHKVQYELNKTRAINKKIEASDRQYTVVPELKSNNFVLTFSAAPYEEFKTITTNYIYSQGLSVNCTATKDKADATVSESYAVYEGNKKLFVLNFYNSTSKVLLNGKPKPGSYIYKLVSNKCVRNAGQEYQFHRNQQ